MIWWFSNPSRAIAERRAIAELLERSEWLSEVSWLITPNMAMAVDFTITFNDEAFPLRMTYAAYHPDTPPQIEPRDGRRLSGHQYGAGGNLCLEYRPDNWTPAITGAMMIESAYRLLSGERTPNVPEVSSAHHLSIGQRVRASKARFLISQNFLQKLIALESGQHLEIQTQERFHSRIFVSSIKDMNGEPDHAARTYGNTGATKPAIVIRLPVDTSWPAATGSGITELLESLEVEPTYKRLRAERDDVDLIFVGDYDLRHFASYEKDGEPVFYCSQTIILPQDALRVPENYTLLREKRVGIAGCGSLGSKIAATLARSGVRNFTLIDDDIFFLGNLLRNELSGSAVGVHKVDALRSRLYALGDMQDVVVKRVGLGNQESAETTEAAMSSLRECDIVIDASADPHCFNFTASAARAGLKPFVWGEVFAGGIGGLVARVRPGLEPDPQTARNQLMAWCEERGVPAPNAVPALPYGAEETDTAEPQIADDAEVSIIASHMARFATDALLATDEGLFPVAAYAIGLRPGWIFSSPMDTWPIAMSSNEPWIEELGPEAEAERLQLFQEFFPEVFNDPN